MTKPRRPYIGPSESQSKANAEALDRRSRTYADENAYSLRYSQDRVRFRPVGLAPLSRWARSEYRHEPNIRLHTRDTADDGAPAMSGQAQAFLGMTYGEFGGILFDRAADPTDWTSVACQRNEEGYYVTPMRCTLARIDKSNPDDTPILEAAIHGRPFDGIDSLRNLPERWRERIVLGALNELYDRYSDTPPAPRKRTPKEEVAA